MAKLDFKNASRRNRNLKYGGYSAVVSIIVLVVLVVANLMFEKLNLDIDLTTEELYSVGVDSQQVLDELEDDVNIYAFYATGDESGQYASMIIDFLVQYANLSDHITYELKDPVKDPAFANQYLTSTTETISSGNIVVADARTGRYKILDISDMLQVTYNSASSSGYSVTGWNAESAVTGAVQYVTSDETPVIYQLVGHGEVELDETVKKYLNTSNFDVENLSLVGGDELNATTYHTILVNNPKTDLNEKEFETLLNYMDNGGRMIFLADYDESDPQLPNFDLILERFGLGIDRTQYVVETNMNNYYQSPAVTLPNKQDKGEDTHQIIANMSQNDQVMVLAPVAVQIKDNMNRATIQNYLLTTSDDALIKGEGNTALAYEDGDVQGPFNVAVLVTEQEQIGTKVETAELLVMGSSSFINSAKASGYILNGNYLFFLNACSYMQDEVSSLYIPAKQFTTARYRTTMSRAITGGVVFIVVIPLIIIAAGIIIWIRRKNL